MARHLFLSLIVAAVCVFLPGCSLYQIDSQNITPDYYPPKASQKDVAYVEKIEKPYEVVGTVTVVTDNGRAFPDVIEQMRPQAALLGGDIITAVTFKPEGPLRRCYTAKVAVFK